MTSAAPADPVPRLADLARRHGLVDLERDAEELATRLAEGRTYVAVVGQFKRGKSSLINALVGARAVPTGVVPVTRVPTVVRFGAAGARVRLPSGWRPVPVDALSEYVSEAGNPGNRLGVVGAEVFAESPLLAGGLCLVDTPGLGSIEPTASTATHELLPRVDAALLLLGADAPITGEELAIAERFLAADQPLLVALGKGDRATAAERDAIRAYAERALRPGTRLYVVSGVAPPGSDGNPDWQELRGGLERVAQGRELLAAAGSRGVARLASRIGAALVAERAALLRPAAESAARAANAERTEAAARQALADLTPLLRADVERLRLRAEAAAAAFLRSEHDPADAALVGRAGGLPRADALRAANETARERLAPWFASMEGVVARELEAIADRFRHSCDGILRSAGDGVLEDATDGLSLAAVTLGARHFHFHDRLRTRAAAASFVDRWLPRRMAAARALRAARRYLADLLEVNASRAEGDLTERARDAVGIFEAAVQGALSRVTLLTRDAARKARQAQDAGKEAVAARVRALDAALQDLQEIVAADRGSAVAQ